MERLGGFVRPPFATYDIVVYFGGGLFAVPFIYRYLLQPFGLSMPTFTVPMGDGLLAETVAVLTTLFVIYIAGHMLAYAGSQFIEKFVDRIFGKISSAIIVSSKSNPANRDEHIQALIYSQVSKIKSERAVIPSLVRFSLHLLMSPIYLAIFGLGFFGYYDSRVPKAVLDRAEKKFKKLSSGECKISIDSKWYKALEYYVINQNPLASLRMYNYLVIGGLFRTIALVFLLSTWAQSYYISHYLFDGEWKLQPLMGSEGKYMGVIELSLTIVAYIFSLFSYLKFQRRYAEEAIFGFVFQPENG